MKDVFKYIGVALLIVFSFYYTDKISTLIIYKSDLMQVIESQKELYESVSVNAVIESEYITPGLNGLEVDALSSYYQMKSSNKFNSDKLIYKQIFPEINLEDNRHLVINKINPLKKAVAIIVNSQSDAERFMKEHNIKANILKGKELLENGEVSDICFIKNKNEKCEQRYLVTYTYTLNNQNIVNNNVKSGDIIYIDNNLTRENLKLLFKDISFRDLQIDYLSKLISEER